MQDIEWFITTRCSLIWWIFEWLVNVSLQTDLKIEEHF